MATKQRLQVSDVAGLSIGDAVSAEHPGHALGYVTELSGDGVVVELDRPEPFAAGEVLIGPNAVTKVETASVA